MEHIGEVLAVMALIDYYETKLEDAKQATHDPTSGVSVPVAEIQERINRLVNRLHSISGVPKN